MSSFKDSFEFLRELELMKKKNRILEASYEAGKITRSTYEYIKKDLTKTLVDLEAHMKTLPEKDEDFTFKVLSEDSKKSEMDEEQFKPQKDIYVSETSSSRTETENIERAFKESYREKVSPEKGFHFYEGIEKPTGQIALSLEDFAKKVSMISFVSLEFHQERGDFANWIRETFNEYSLAETIGKLNEQGENLRRKIIETIEGLEQHYIFPCPNCGKEVNPHKIWKMVGRPNKVGKSLQLTLGCYKCPNCEKSFRQVLAKEII